MQNEAYTIIRNAFSRAIPAEQTRQETTMCYSTQVRDEILELCKTKKYTPVVGNGMEFHKVEAFEMEADNLTVMRSLPAEEFDEMLFGCDAGMIFLDHRFTIPNFPSRILSYMQAGLPVLSCTDVNTDVGTIAQNNGFGWSCCSDDVNAFCETLQKAAADLQQAETCKAMGESSKRYLQEHYTVKETYAQIFSQLGE